jgi:hypothetical protein
VKGEGLFGTENERATDGKVVLFAPDSDEVKIENPFDAKATLKVLLIGRGAAERANLRPRPICDEYGKRNPSGD